MRDVENADAAAQGDSDAYLQHAVCVNCVRQRANYLIEPNASMLQN